MMEAKMEVEARCAEDDSQGRGEDLVTGET